MTAGRCHGWAEAWGAGWNRGPFDIGMLLILGFGVSATVMGEGGRGGVDN